MMDRHLDSETMERWLAGERGASAGEHLGVCPECRAEVARLESLLAGFRGAAREWSGRQPLARPPAGWAASTIAPRRRLTVMRWAAVAVAAGLLAAIPAYRDYRRREAAAQAAAQAAANALLLEQVSADISRPVPEPLAPLIELVSQPATGDNQ